MAEEIALDLAGRGRILKSEDEQLRNRGFASVGLDARGRFIDGTF